AEAVDSRAVFGQVMGLVAVTTGFFALGAYLGRDLTGGGIWILFIGAFGCVFGANIAARRRIEWLAITLLFGIGLFLGLAFGPVPPPSQRLPRALARVRAGAAGARRSAPTARQRDPLLRQRLRAVDQRRRPLRGVRRRPAERRPERAADLRARQAAPHHAAAERHYGGPPAGRVQRQPVDQLERSLRRLPIGSERPRPRRLQQC